MHVEHELSFPMGVFFDAESEKVFVVDQGNHRVLIWNKIPRETGVAADVPLKVEVKSRSPIGSPEPVKL